MLAQKKGECGVSKKIRSVSANLDRLGYLDKLEETLKDAGFPSVAPASVRETLEARQRETVDLGVALKKALDAKQKKDIEISELKAVVARLRASLARLEKLLVDEQNQKNRALQAALQA